MTDGLKSSSTGSVDCGRSKTPQFVIATLSLAVRSSQPAAKSVLFDHLIGNGDSNSGAVKPGAFAILRIR